MRAESLFGRLFLYRDGDIKSQQENFMTEIFASVLTHDRYVFSELMKLIWGEAAAKVDQVYEVKTQHHHQAKFYDLCISLTFDNKPTLLVFEHKYGSAVDGDQISSYVGHDAFDISWQNETHRPFEYKGVVYVCREHARRQAMVYSDKLQSILSWTDICIIVSESTHPLSSEFHKYLLELGEGPISPIPAYEVYESSQSREFHKKYFSLFNQFLLTYEDELKSLMGCDSSRKLKYWSHWGRVGIESDLDGWSPNVFVGLLYDGQDNGVKKIGSQETFNRSSHKDFYLLISVDGLYKSNWSSETYHELMKVVSLIPKGTEIYLSNSYNGVKLKADEANYRFTSNKWRKAMIVAPFTDHVRQDGDVGFQLTEMMHWYRRWLLELHAVFYNAASSPKD